MISHCCSLLSTIAIPLPYSICLGKCKCVVQVLIFRLAQADVVITTYNIVQKEVKLPESLKKDKNQQGKPALEDEVGSALCLIKQLINVALSAFYF